MSWDRAIDLFLNLGLTPSYALLGSKTTVKPAVRPTLVSGDKHLVRLWLVDTGEDGVTPTLQALAAGDVMVLSGKKRASDSDLLFYVADFTESAEGGTHYEATLDLNTEELLAAFGDETSLLTTAEVEIENAANTLRRSRQFQVQINRAIYNNETEPIPATPVYPAPNAIALKTPDAGAYRIKTDGDGSFLQLKNSGTGKFHSVFIRGAAGAEELAIGPGED